MGFKRFEADLCAFRLMAHDELVEAMVVHVDDVGVRGMESVICVIFDAFKDVLLIKDMRYLGWNKGCEFLMDRETGAIEILQRNYI